jgi:hypothetical protein
MWPEGTFLTAYAANIESSVDSALEAHAVGAAVLEMMASLKEWSGTATTLLTTLTNEVGEVIAHRQSWPKNPRTMSGSLRRASPLLRDRNIDVKFMRDGHKRKRTIHILKLESEEVGNFASAPSAGAASAPVTDTTHNDSNNISGTKARSQTDSALRQNPALRPQSHSASAAGGLDADANEAADANDKAAAANRFRLATAANQLTTNDNLDDAGPADDADANFPTLAAPENEGTQKLGPASDRGSENHQKPAKTPLRYLGDL